MILTRVVLKVLFHGLVREVNLKKFNKITQIYVSYHTFIVDNESVEIFKPIPEINACNHDNPVSVEPHNSSLEFDDLKIEKHLSNINKDKNTFTENKTSKYSVIRKWYAKIDR